MFICDCFHYYLCVINVTKNEGNVIDGFNTDSGYKRKNENTFKLFWLMPEIGQHNTKSCSVSRQTDGNMCGMTTLMVIHQIYIQSKTLKNMYSASYYETFQELFYHTIFTSVVVLLKKKLRKYRIKRRKRE